MEPVRAQAAPRKRLGYRMTALGHRRLRPSAPLTEPNNRMVGPETGEHNDFPFWAQPSALVPFAHRDRSPQGADGVAL
jgi:hypothetical protein